MRFILLAAFLLTGCVTAPPPPAAGNPLAGIWRAASGQSLSISLFSSFATQRGCTVTGGMLEPLGNGAYRIGRYTTGHATDGCGPWRSDASIAPFDGAQVTLRRTGRLLVAEGTGRSVTFRWVGPSPV